MTVQHGVYYSYSDGCRCLACATAWAVYQKQRRHHREESTAENGRPPAKVTHGLSTYNNWGCRCHVCTEAKRARNKADKARRRRTT